MAQVEAVAPSQARGPLWALRVTISAVTPFGLTAHLVRNEAKPFATQQRRPRAADRCSV